MGVLSVILAVASFMALGFIWYGPLLGRAWMGAVGKKPEDLGNPTVAIATSAVMGIVMAVVSDL